MRPAVSHNTTIILSRRNLDPDTCQKEEHPADVLPHRTKASYCGGVQRPV